MWLLKMVVQVALGLVLKNLFEDFPFTSVNHFEPNRR